MKKIYMHGSFMNDNYGDFLLYYITASSILVHENSLLISADVSDTYDEFIEINRESKYGALLSCDAAILAGGGYFSEPPTRKLFWNIRFLIKHALPLLLLGKRNAPYAIIGVGAGPIKYKFNKIICRKIFNGAKVVSVRDQESKSFLESIGVEREIFITPDWVMGMAEEQLLCEYPKVVEQMGEKDYDEYIYIHLTTKNDGDDSGMNKVVNDILKYSKENKNAFFIVGCDQKRESQEERAKLIVSQLPQSRVQFYPYQGPWMLTGMLKYVNTVITDKLHVGIVATKLNKFVISVPYHTKTLRFYNQMGLSGRSKIISEVEEGFVYNKLFSSERTIEKLNEIVDRSKINNELLNEFLDDL